MSLTVAATKLTHLLKMSAKIRLRADPAARAAQLEALNAPVTQRRRLASINAIALDLAAKHGTSPAHAFAEAVQVLAQIKGSAAYRAAVKRSRAGRRYPADGAVAHAASRYQAAVAVEVAA